MWNYRCHRLLMVPLELLRFVPDFICDLSWSYAHYKNGHFMTMRKGTKDKNSILITAGFWQRVKWAYSSACNPE